MTWGYRGLFAVVVCGCIGASALACDSPGGASDGGTPLDAARADAGRPDAGPPIGLEVPIVFVSRTPGADGSFYWPAPGGPRDMPGVGARSRVRPSAPGRLLVLEPDGTIRTLVDGSAPTEASLHLVDVSAPAVSYDGTTIAFAGLPDGDYASVDFGSAYGTRAVGAWRIYLIGADGTSLRQLTTDDTRDAAAFRSLFGRGAGDALVAFDDYDPVFLPDGRLCFASTRWPAFAHYSGQRTSNLFVVGADGTGLHRITAERNGADRPSVDPLTGEIVYARWWRNLRYPTNDMTTDERTPAEIDAIAADISTVRTGLRAFDRFLGVTRDRYDSEVFYGDTMFRNAWHIASIRPDGTDLHMWSGYQRSEDANHTYGGTFTDDGTYFANFFPIINMTESAGFGGIRRYTRGPGHYEDVLGVTSGIRTDFVAPDPRGIGVPSFGVYDSVYAAEAAVLPVSGGARSGDLVVAMTATAADVGQDYGLYRVRQDGTVVGLVHDEPGTAELRPVVLAPRTVPPVLADVVTAVASALPPPAIPYRPEDGDQSAVMQDGSFTFHVLNVYANAPVDVEMVSAIPVGRAATLRGFADYQRINPGSFEELDWPMLIETTSVSLDGEAMLHPPANLPLFEDLRDAMDRVPQTGGRAGATQLDQGASFVAGMNFGRPGATVRCVGCHTGHSMLPVPATAEEAAWTNLAPGAEVTLSSVDAEAQRETMSFSIVNRRVETDRNAFDQWRTSEADAQDGQWARLSFEVPIRVREVVLWNQRQDASGGNPTDLHVVRATVVLYADAAGTTELGRVATSSVGVTGGSRVDVSSIVQAAGVRAVTVILDDVEGRMYGRMISSLGEVEVIGRGDPG